MRKKFSQIEEAMCYIKAHEDSGPFTVEIITDEYVVTPAPKPTQIYRITKRFFAGDYPPVVRVEKPGYIGNPGIILTYFQAEVDVRATDEEDAKYQGLNMIDSVVKLGQLKFR